MLRKCTVAASSALRPTQSRWINTAKLARKNKRMANAAAKETPVVEKSAGMDPYVRDIGVYMISAATLLLGTAYYKNMTEDDSLETLVFLQAKHTAIRNKVVIDVTGLPTTIDMLPDPVPEGSTMGDATVEYTADAGELDDKGKYKIHRLDLIQRDGTVVSLLTPQPKAVLTEAEDAEVKEQRKDELKALVSKLAIPALMCFGVGCTAGYFILRILKNRPAYIIQACDASLRQPQLTSRVVKDFLGHPIKTNKNTYVGSITDTFAKFESVCKGPKGEGTMYVQAVRPNTPNAIWEFTHLSMGVKGRAKKINILDSVASGAVKK
ncbi:hypothetical protein ACHHYP_01532 [Achlya hypogyna]|uniref:Uncharacterized protein n=1 Tax=Achlya hypogyna TaxID=1202772 RepID=A0A1V9Z8E9_ACHHY|nr:hypothetical protein ACHHYP_01532 [Achlya hypogyna]